MVALSRNLPGFRSVNQCDDGQYQTLWKQLPTVSQILYIYVNYEWLMTYESRVEQLWALKAQARIGGGKERIGWLF